MSFFEDLKDIMIKIWEGFKPTFWEVFRYALALVINYADGIAQGLITKAEARENGVKAIVEHFSNSPEFSENMARLALEYAVAWYKRFGKTNSRAIIEYDHAPDFMAWWSTRPDKG